VAFLNTEGGTLVIGVADNGDIVGVERVDETLKKLSDVITDQIEPNPQDIVRPELKFEDGKNLIFLSIPKGDKNIYCIKKFGYSSSGCPIRIGTTCKEMTPQQIRIRYEKNFTESEYMLETRARYADISFRALKVYYAEKAYHLLPKSVEANFNLRTKNGEYNLLAELLSDQNNIPMIFVKFKGLDRASISARSDYGYCCIISAFEKLRDRLIAENICISDTTVRPRLDTYLFNIDCVTEAVINSIVHNDWTISEPLVSFFEDRVEISSHGGLPNGLSEEQFFEGITKPRNTTLMRIFLNLGITEHTGHGVPTIVSNYGKDVFSISDTFLKCTIPFNKLVTEYIRTQNVGINVGMNVVLNKTEQKILELLIEDPKQTAENLSKRINSTIRTAERTLKSLQEKNYLTRIGSRRDGHWIVKR
jgi:predicted HTH transcriptional regulator